MDTGVCLQNCSSIPALELLTHGGKERRSLSSEGWGYGFSSGASHPAPGLSTPLCGMGCCSQILLVLPCHTAEDEVQASHLSLSPCPGAAV